MSSELQSEGTAALYCQDSAVFTRIALNLQDASCGMICRQCMSPVKSMRRLSAVPRYRVVFLLATDKR